MTTTEESLQRLVALEHEAVWWFAVAAARPTLRTRAATALRGHRASRDRLLATLDTRSIEAPAPQAGYAAPGAGATPDQIVEHSQGVENRIAAAALDVIGRLDPDDDLRPAIVAQVTRAAVAAHGWGAPVDAFPGLD